MLTCDLLVLEVYLLKAMELSIDVLDPILNGRKEPADICVVEQHLLIWGPPIDMEVLLKYQVNDMNDRLQKNDCFWVFGSRH